MIKLIKKHYKKVIIVLVIVLYLGRFVIGITGIPGPFIGTSNLQVDVTEENATWNFVEMISKLLNREKYEYRVPDFTVCGFSTNGKLPDSQIVSTKIR